MKRILIYTSMALVLCAGMAGVAVWLWRQHQQSRFDPIIVQAAKRYGLPPSLVKAVVWKESAFRSSIRGRAGEFGLMQIREMAGQEWADAEKREAWIPEHLADPQTNTFAGTWYLAKLIRRYAHTDDPVPYALADYNAGRSNVLKWLKGNALTNSEVFIEQIGFPTTKFYVRAIRDQQKLYLDEFR